MSRDYRDLMNKIGESSSSDSNFSGDELWDILKVLVGIVVVLRFLLAIFV